MCRILGVNGPKLAHFYLKYGGHFYGPPPQKRVLALLAWGISQGFVLRREVKHEQPPSNSAFSAETRIRCARDSGGRQRVSGIFVKNF